MPDPYRSKGFGGRYRRSRSRAPEPDAVEPAIVTEPTEPAATVPVPDDDGAVPESPPIYGPGSAASAWRAWMAEATDTVYADWASTSRNEIVTTAFRRGLLHATDPAIKVVLPDEYVDLKGTG